MNPRLRNTAALLGVTGMVALAGCGTDDTSGVAGTGAQAANAAQDVPGYGQGAAPPTGGQAPGGTQNGAPSGTPPGGQAPGGAAGRPPGAPELSALAGELGVSEAKLQSALEAKRPEPGTAPSGDPFAKLADALGGSESKLRSAMEAVSPMGQPPSQGQAPSSGGADTTTS